MTPSARKYIEGALVWTSAGGIVVIGDSLFHGNCELHTFAVAGGASLIALAAYLRQTPRENWHAEEKP